MNGLGSVIIDDGGARLVVRLVDPPRTRVVLSIDDTTGTHFELTWDPAVNDGLQHSIVLPAGVWGLTPSVEDDRIQTGQVVLAFSTSFSTSVTKQSIDADGLQFTGSTVALLATPQMKKLEKPEVAPGNPSLVLSCENGQVEMSSLHLDTRRISAALNARGLLDQAVSEPVKEALSLIAEIAIERAKAGAMDLVKKKFVDPMCNQLTLGTLRLDGSTRAFPRTCAILENLRLDDVLSSGKDLVDAAKDDVRRTLAPALLNKARLGDETRELAQLALEFGNRMLDGESNEVVEIDLLIALLDRLSSSSGFEHSAPIVKRWMAAQKDLDVNKLKNELLESILPEEFGELANPPWADVPKCRKRYTRQPAAGEPPSGPYYNPIRKDCLDALLAKLGTDWITQASTLGYFEVADVVTLMRSRAATNLGVWLKNANIPAKELIDGLPFRATPLLENACAARVIVGITKWCSGRESCSAGDIANALDAPSKIFAKSSRFPELLCWRDDGSFRMPPSMQKFIELSTRLFSFLTPVQVGKERDRAVAMVRWMFDMIRAVDRESTAIDQIEEIIDHLLNRNYLRALTSTIALAQEEMCRNDESCTIPTSVVKSAQLVGAVASYVRTYDETKSLDAIEARAARKKALESLIDSATDRKGRAGNRIYSLGVPVGFAVGARWTPGGAARYESVSAAYDRDTAFQWRVPLAIARQSLPTEEGYCGTHMALWLADLGQFVRKKPAGVEDEISWKDFVAVGAQLGVLLGGSDHSVVLALEGSWSPALYERTVNIDNANGDGGTHPRVLSGAFTLGFTFAYYVPLFDFN